MSGCSSAASAGMRGPSWRAGACGRVRSYGNRGPRRGQSTAKLLHGQGTEEELRLLPAAATAGRSWIWYRVFL